MLLSDLMLVYGVVVVIHVGLSGYMQRQLAAMLHVDLSSITGHDS